MYWNAGWFYCRFRSALLSVCVSAVLTLSHSFLWEQTKSVAAECDCCARNHLSSRLSARLFAGSVLCVCMVLSLILSVTDAWSSSGIFENHLLRSFCVTSMITLIHFFHLIILVFTRTEERGKIIISGGSHSSNAMRDRIKSLMTKNFHFSLKKFLK